MTEQEQKIIDHYQQAIDELAGYGWTMTLKRMAAGKWRCKFSKGRSAYVQVIGYNLEAAIRGAARSALPVARIDVQIIQEREVVA